MANKSVNERTKIEIIIKLEIEYIFGRRILSSRDCIQLSDEIFRKTQVQLNPNTLRRFFGLVKADYPASLSTLNTLSVYCGFHSLDDVHGVKHKESEEMDCVPLKSVLDYLVSLYNDTHVPDANNKILQAWIKHTLDFLNKNPGLMERFQSGIIKTRNGQKHYFEHFVHIDKLNSYYGRGLRHCISEKQTGPAFVFACSLLVFKSWLSGEDENLERNFYLINNPCSLDIDASVCGRYFAAMLYHAQASSISYDSIITEISNFHSTLKLNKHKSKSFLSFELAVGEALVLTGNCKEGLYYFDQALERYNHPVYESETHQFIYLFQAIACYKLGDGELSLKIFDQVNPGLFSFLSKKYLTALYLSLSLQIKRRISKHEEELTSLISELGFSRIVTVLHGSEEIVTAALLKKIV